MVTAPVMNFGEGELYKQHKHEKVGETVWLNFDMRFLNSFEAQLPPRILVNSFDRHRPNSSEPAQRDEDMHYSKSRELILLSLFL